MEIECGFETVGNATLICHDNRPVLVTDPWLDGSAYFGSWKLAYEIPARQKENISNCEFVWVSHGHPDHLSIESLKPLLGKKLLLPNHVGGRIEKDLTQLGFDVTVLNERTWTKLSERIRVLCISDYNQDSILLVDIGGTLVLNLNDASPRGWGGFIKNIARGYAKSFLLQISGYGDADMINYFDEDGARIEPRAALKLPVGATMARVAETLGVRYVVPFSSLHKYQRTDSVWANEYITPLGAFGEGFESETCESLPAFLQYDCLNDEVEEIDPAPTSDTIVESMEFGDDWTQPLENNDFQRIHDYLKPIAHLGTAMDFVNIRVGGIDNIVQFTDKGFNKGVMFEVPRRSLMRAIRFEIFDDLLIGNFMKTTLIGKWPQSKLYPDFAPYVGKYADNGLAKSEKELKEYFREYRKRDPMEYFRHQLQNSVAGMVRRNLDTRSPLYQMAQKTWWFALRNLPVGGGHR